ncbi:FecR domain-containing protein [Turneriella parva]|uniref:FecR family protein n=1 Tax=Turneriella parva (strain ATCC BAA-1111 / DSM 21527 / NCTC 11395 / H) TaxID=869212 RepID=I4B564_TURPD|nr:FecR domain-containing protein [Turneriella parva]AFM12421.1 FecR family protein [Turneriella parva DSM 21527]
MKFSKADAAFTAAMLGGIAILSGLLYLHNSRRTAGKGESIGKVFFKREVAMRKFSDRMVWEDVENGSPLYSLDAVMTGNYSDAELVLNSGLKLKLEANTLVELDLEQSGLKLRLSGGGIKTAGAQNAQTVVTTTDGQAINVTQADASIRTTGKQTAVEVKEGQVQVVGKDGQTQTVAKDEVLAEGKKARITLQLTGILEDAVILAAGKTGKVMLGCSGNARTAEVSQRSDMSSARQIELENGKATTTLAAGDWYTRCKGEGGSISATRHFRVVEAGNYQIAQSASYDEKPAIRFEIKPPRGVTSTQIEIADNAQFVNPVYAETTSRSSVVVNVPKDGRYYYRLRPASESGRVDSQLPPATGSVVVQRNEKRAGLGFLSLGAASYSRSQVESGKAVVAFEGAERANYEILQRGSDKVLRSGETQRSSVELPADLAAGKYTLRVKSSSGEKAELPFEVRDKVRVELVEPVNNTVVFLPPQQKTVGLAIKWRGSAEITLYQVLIAEDAAMQKVLKKLNVEDTEFRFTGLTARTYFVKVLALENNLARAESAAHQVVVQDKLPPVAELYPKDDQKVDITRSAGLNLKWQPVTGASSYEVKVFQKRKGGLVLVDSRVTKTTALTVSDLKKLKEGEMVWEVRAQQADRTGKVVQQSEPVRNTVNVSFGATPPAPEIVPTVE